MIFTAVFWNCKQTTYIKNHLIKSKMCVFWIHLNYKFLNYILQFPFFFFFTKSGVGNRVLVCGNAADVVTMVTVAGRRLCA